MDWFTTVIEYIKIAGQMLLNFLGGIITLFRLLLRGLTLPTTFLQYVPSFMVPAVIVFTAVAVIKIILARGNK